MKDQVRQLRKRNVAAMALHSGMNFFEVKKVLEIGCEGHLKFLYLSPERLQTNLFKEYLPGLNVNLVAVDEAHCISQWGYDFRPAYLQIASLRDEMPHVPMLALTASATSRVQQDIMTQLRFSMARKLFRQSFARPNLSFSAFELPQKVNKLVQVLQGVPIGIVPQPQADQRNSGTPATTRHQRYSLPCGFTIGRAKSKTGRLAAQQSEGNGVHQCLWYGH
jgi:ATP-dependent DNA helicase RecQ